MDKKKINTVDMVRKIRDEHAKRLAGKSDSERIAFYRERAKKLEKKLPDLLSELAVVNGGKGDDSKGSPDNQPVDTLPKRIRERRGIYKKKK